MKLSFDPQRSRELERWIAWGRVGAVALAVVLVAIAGSYPPGYERWAWVTTALFLTTRSSADRARIRLRGCDCIRDGLQL